MSTNTHATADKLLIISMRKCYNKETLKRKENGMRHEIRYQLSGWILFVVCAVFFIASSLKSQDILMIIGSIVFLFACILFLIPLVRHMRNSQNNE